MKIPKSDWLSVYHSWPNRSWWNENGHVVRKYALAVGEAILAWNRCQTAFAAYFIHLMNQANPNAGYRVWHCLQNDMTQRDQFLALATATIGDKRLLRRLRWAKKAADALSPLRNDAAHLSIAFTTEPEALDIALHPEGTAPARGTRLTGKNLRKHFRVLAGDLHALAGYVSALRFLPQDKWPRRPKLRSLPSQSARSKARLRKTKRHRQRAA